MSRFLHFFKILETEDFALKSTKNEVARVPPVNFKIGPFFLPVFTFKFGKFLILSRSEFFIFEHVRISCATPKIIGFIVQLLTV